MSGVEVLIDGAAVGDNDREGAYLIRLDESVDHKVTFKRDKYRTINVVFPLNFNKTDPGRYILDVGLVPEGYELQGESDSNVSKGITYDEWMRLSNLRFDCNRNGIFDDEEIAQGKLKDDNRNGIPDICE